MCGFSFLNHSLLQRYNPGESAVTVWQPRCGVSAPSGCCQTVSTPNSFKEIGVSCQNTHTPSDAVHTKPKHTVTNGWLIKQPPNHSWQEKNKTKPKNRSVSRITTAAQTVRHITGTTGKTAVRNINSYNSLASLGVVHPVQNDLRSPVPTGHHVARHLSIGAAGQAEVQDLQRKQRGSHTSV